MVNNKNSIKIKQSNKLKDNLENVLDEFKKLDFNNEKNVNEFLKNIIEKFNYIKPILLKEIKGKKVGGTCKKCNIFKGGYRSADRIIRDQQSSVCFLCLGERYERTRGLSNQTIRDRGILKHHEEPGNCQIVAHENCWRDLFQNMDTMICPGCHKILEMQGNEVVISDVPMLNNNNDDDQDNFAAQLNVFIDNNREVDNNDMIYNSLFVALFITFIKLFKMSNNPFIYFILFFCYRFLLKMLNRNYRRNPNPPLGIIALGYMVIPFFVLILANLTIESISILGGPNLIYDTYDNIKNIIEIIHEKIISDEIDNPDFNQLRNQVLDYNNNTNVLYIEGGYKKTKKNKKKINKTKKRIRKQKGSGNILPTFRNSRVQPEDYAYINYNTTSVVPSNSVPIHQYTTFRCNWKYNIRQNFTDDYDGIFVDDYLDVIINPIDENAQDWIFAGVTDENIKDEIGEYMTYYRRLLFRSYTNEEVRDLYSDQLLSTYDIQKKIYELLKIRKY